MVRAAPVYNYTSRLCCDQRRTKDDVPRTDWPPTRSPVPIGLCLLQTPPQSRREPFPFRQRSQGGCMLAAVLRAPSAPIPPRLPAPTRPLLRRRGLCFQPEAPMASASARDEGAVKPDPAPVPEPPEKPLPGDCCGSGCVRCVWDIYYDELEAYNKALAAQPSSSSTESGGKISSDSKTSDDANS
jgi:hypothetical protein